VKKFALVIVLFVLSLLVSAQTSVDFPINLNTATDAQILAIPNTGPRMLREFKEYRPYATVEQFRRELGKYVDQTQVTAWLQYVFVPTNPNTATEAQLTALKGVDKEMATYIIANRTYKDAAATKAALLKKYKAEDVAKLERYWTF
jgi:DNA uptake protein ComE-like DNA-binding protein